MASTITSMEELRSLYGAPKTASIKKQASALTDVYRQWIEQSCFFVIASVGADGLDCTPRGDEHGQAFAITNSTTIVIPDRRGNNRLDTLSNIINDPRVALLFFIPGIDQAVRVIGRATISTEQTLIDQFTLNENRPVSCISISIEAVFFQNARAMGRSQLWNPDLHRPKHTVPTPGEMINSVDPDFDPKSYDAG